MSCEEWAGCGAHGAQCWGLGQEPRAVGWDRTTPPAFWGGSHLQHHHTRAAHGKEQQGQQWGQLRLGAGSFEPPVSPIEGNHQHHLALCAKFTIHNLPSQLVLYDLNRDFFKSFLNTRKGRVDTKVLSQALAPMRSQSQGS